MTPKAPLLINLLLDHQDNITRACYSNPSVKKVTNSIPVVNSFQIILTLYTIAHQFIRYFVFISNWECLSMV